MLSFEKKLEGLNSDWILGEFLAAGVTIVGHQLSSDIGVILNRRVRPVPRNFRALKELWHNRRDGLDGGARVFDTRYDLEGFLSGKSRRLYVCTECKLDVTQPELRGSMTKMQNEFLATKDRGVVERLQVLNLRHSLSAGILFLLYRDLRANLGMCEVGCFGSWCEGII